MGDLMAEGVSAHGYDLLIGDCLEEMRGLPDRSVDCVVTDPPYQQTSLPWDRWVSGWMAEVGRVLKPSGSVWVFGSLRMFMDRRDEFDGWKMAQDIVWEKHNGSSLHADRFRRVHEQAVQFYRGRWGDVWKGKVVTDDAPRRTVTRKKGRPTHMGVRDGGTYNSEDGGPRLQRSVIFARSEHGRAVHPTQKPIEIVEPLILASCPPGGTVLDLFGGSGTTAGAAIKHGRRAILIELNPEYAALIPDRVRAILEKGSEPMSEHLTKADLAPHPNPNGTPLEERMAVTWPGQVTWAEPKLGRFCSSCAHYTEDHKFTHRDTLPVGQGICRMCYTINKASKPVPFRGVDAVACPKYERG